MALSAQGRASRLEALVDIEKKQSYKIQGSPPCAACEQEEAWTSTHCCLPKRHPIRNQLLQYHRLLSLLADVGIEIGPARSDQHLLHRPSVIPTYLRRASPNMF